MKKIYMFITLFALVLTATAQTRDTWTEDFNDQHSGSYGTSFTMAISGTWTCQDAGNFSYANSQMGSYAFTINDDKAGAQITTPVLNTCGTVSFKYAYKSGNSSNVFVLQKSTDGTNFTDLDTHTLGASANLNYVNYSFDVNDNASSIYIRILSDDQNAHLFIDDFSVTDYSSGTAPDNPTDFLSTAVSTSEIDLSWTQNGDGDDVMVAWSSDGTFGTPTDGTDYSVGNTISGGGTVIYNANGTSFNHTGLTAGTRYYYKAWSVDGTTNYSSGTADDATTFKDEPTNHVTGFAAGSAGATTIPLTWTDNDGAVAADGYLVLINTTGTFSAPVDGTPQSDDTNLSDGSGQVNVAHGAEAYRWKGLSQNTQYYFAIYPYTNAGTAINYKTDGTVPTTTAVTTVVFGAPSLFISEYIEGSGNNKALEIYNGTGADVDLSAYQIWKISNGGSWPESTLSLSGTLANGDVYVIYNSGADADIVSVGNTVWGSATWNGDDAVGLAKDDGTGTFVLIDAVGEDGSDPGSGWDVAGVTNATANHTLVRKSSVLSPNTDWASSAGTSTANSEWIVYDQNDFTHIGYHITNAPPVPVSNWAIALFVLLTLVFIGVKNKLV